MSVNSTTPTTSPSRDVGVSVFAMSGSLPLALQPPADIVQEIRDYMKRSGFGPIFVTDHEIWEAYAEDYHNDIGDR